MLVKYPDLVVIQFDAHADLRSEYTGTKFSHATVMRRVVELLGPGRLYQPEFVQQMRKNSKNLKVSPTFFITKR